MIYRRREIGQIAETEKKVIGVGAETKNTRRSIIRGGIVVAVVVVGAEVEADLIIDIKRENAQRVMKLSTNSERE